MVTRLSATQVGEGREAFVKMNLAHDLRCHY
jgi:hypothetical protein